MRQASEKRRMLVGQGDGGEGGGGQKELEFKGTKVAGIWWPAVEAISDGLILS